MLTYVYAVEYYTVIKKEENPAIGKNMDEPGGHHVK